jgi:hypothetical protein
MLAGVNTARQNTMADTGRRDAALQQLQSQYASTGQSDLQKAMADITAQGGSTADLQGRYGAMQNASAQSGLAQQMLTQRLDGSQTDALNSRDAGTHQLQLNSTQGTEQNFAQMLAQLMGKRADVESGWADKIAQYKASMGQ